MIGTTAAAAAAKIVLTASLSTSAFGLSASPAAVHAVGHHTYRIAVTNTGTQPEVVYSVLSRATQDGADCRLDDSHPDALGWAHLRSAPVFRLAPGATKTVRLHIGTPPAGRTDLVEGFFTRPGQGQVGTSAGVGVTLAFAEPGHTTAQPCSHVAAPAVSGPRVPLGAIGLMGAALIGLALTGLAAMRRRLRRAPGRHAR